VKWADWSTGQTSWPFGPLVPDAVLYEFGGPAIFTTRIGLDRLLFYKSDEHELGEYYVAVALSEDEIEALKKGRLSVRGALAQPRCWLLDVDFDLNVRRYEEKRTITLTGILPSYGIPLHGSMRTAPDSIQQATSPLAFKFFGDELRDGLMPFSTFKGLVNSVYEVVRRSLIPPSLSAGRDSDLLDFPIQQPLLASLLIAIHHPSINVGLLRRRPRTKNLDPKVLVEETEAEGARFVEQIERTVEVAVRGKITKTFARDNFSLLDNIAEIIPAEQTDVSKLQLTSYFGGTEHFVEVDRAIGDRIRDAYKEVRDNTVTLTGTIVGLMERSRTFVLRNRFGRQITCYVVPSIYDNLLAEGELVIGRSLKVTGAFQKRAERDLMKVEGRPTLL
jgi:hypothetical protein